MRVVLSIFAFIILSASSGRAQEITTFELKPGPIDCDSKVQRCSYVTKNLGAQTLISRLLQVLYPNSALSQEDGYIFAETDRKINFWLKNQELQERLQLLIPLFDRLKEFEPQPMVQVTIEVLGITEETERELEVRISELTSEAADKAEAIYTAASGVLTLQNRVGSYFLSSVLGAQATQNKVSRMVRIVRLIPNNSPINYEQMTTVHFAPTPGSPKNEWAGLEFSGIANIHRNNPDLVEISNLNFRMGILQDALSDDEKNRIALSTERDPRNYVNLVEFQNTQAILTRGVSEFLVAANQSQTRAKDGVGIIYLGKNKSEGFSRTMITIRAEAVQFEEFLSQSRKLAASSDFRRFTPSEVKAFSKKPLSDPNEMFKNLETYAEWDLSGNRRIGFKIPKSFARRNNYQQAVQISVTWDLFINEACGTPKPRTVETLMLNGFSLDQLIPSRAYLEPIIKLFINFEPVGQANEVFDSQEVELIFIPEENRFVK